MLRENENLTSHTPYVTYFSAYGATTPTTLVNFNGSDGSAPSGSLITDYGSPITSLKKERRRRRCPANAARMTLSRLI